jgi:hypothetical protein
MWRGDCKPQAFNPKPFPKVIHPFTQQTNLLETNGFTPYPVSKRTGAQTTGQKRVHKTDVAVTKENKSRGR